MSQNKETGQPSGRVPPSENQVPEPQLWPLLYDLNGKVTRMDEAVDGLKERVNSIDNRLEALRGTVPEIAKDVSAARGSISTLKWVFGLLIPVLTVLLDMIARHFSH